jgi:peroxiredoxin
MAPLAPLAPGSKAPSIPGIDFGAGPTVVFFYKVTCPVCQLAAPRVETFERAYPGRIVGVGQDPEPKLDGFGRRYGLTFPRLVDPPPYELSKAYGIRTVPTTFLVQSDGVIDRTVESWDRDALNDVSRELAGLLRLTFAPVSTSVDGLPAFRPG